MSRLQYEQLPDQIRRAVSKSTFHKALKQGSSLIVVHTRTNERLHFEKKGTKGGCTGCSGGDPTCTECEGQSVPKFANWEPKPIERPVRVPD